MNSVQNKQSLHTLALRAPLRVQLCPLSALFTPAETRVSKNMWVAAAIVCPRIPFFFRYGNFFSVERAKCSVRQRRRGNFLLFSLSKSHVYVGSTNVSSGGCLRVHARHIWPRLTSAVVRGRKTINFLAEIMLSCRTKHKLFHFALLQARRKLLSPFRENRLRQSERKICDSEARPSNFAAIFGLNPRFYIIKLIRILFSSSQ